ncbi:MAG: exo-alpha-sialidase [Spirochaetes bacterium]|nr:exo-alpha-sialidase [Spirochaetota bacterium]
MKIVKILSGAVGFVLILLLALLAYWRFRPNEAEIDRSLGIETWAAVADGSHNSNTDLIFWKDRFYLVHASSPFHFASEECRLIVRGSRDAKTWERLAVIQNPGEDIRDPHFIPVGDTIVMTVLRNRDFTAEPYDTYYTTSADFKSWTPIRSLGHQGWLFWKAVSRDAGSWFVPAYWWEHGKSQLLKSTDGITWTTVSLIHASKTIPGDYNDETAVAFLPDGRMISTARIEVGQDLTGHPEGHTLISVSSPPYTKWSSVTSSVTRLDGPALFPYRDKIFALGRRHVQNSYPAYHGSIFGRYRTSLFQLLEDRLVLISDLPSAGDTSYAGVVLKDGYLYASYYTSPVDRDYPWIMGMLSRSDIRIARVPLEKLYQRAR